MELVARIAVVMIVAAPLVVLALRGTRWDPFPARRGSADAAHDEAADLGATAGPTGRPDPADADARRARAELRALSAGRAGAAPGGGPSDPAVGTASLAGQPASRPSASSASWSAASSRS